MKENRPLKGLFICRFCGYQSSLELRECPECGKVGDLTRKIKESSASETGNYVPPAPNYKSAQPNAPKKQRIKQLVFTCQNCQYQTPNSLTECPECGKHIFSKTESFVKLKNPAVQSVSSENIGKILLGFGIGFLFIAGLVFIGVGPTGKSYPRSSIIANPGENWVGAGVLAIFGLGLIFAGFYFKNK